MKNLIKLLLGVSLLLPSCAYAEDMTLVSYEVVPDCKHPPVWICHRDDNGQRHCVVKQDERCN